MTNLDKIIKGCKKYNKNAQKQLYEIYASKMKGVCYRYVGDIEVAKDVVQDGFIKVFSNIKKFKGKGSFDGWVRRIFVNTAISYIRKNKRINEHLNFEDIEESKILDAEETAVERNLNPGNSKKENIDFIFSSDLTENELIQALQNLPENFKVVFNLFCIEKYKHEEISEMLEIEVATSRSRLSRARNLLQKELREVCLKKLKNEVYG